jgi:hypothetical protein
MVWFKCCWLGSGFCCANKGKQRSKVVTNENERRKGKQDLIRRWRFLLL